MCCSVFHRTRPQEMFAFAVTPGLANRTFGAAARIAYLRYGVLLIGARVPLSAGAAAAPADPLADAAGIGGGDDQAFQVFLFPCELKLAAGARAAGWGGVGSSPRYPFLLPTPTSSRRHVSPRNRLRHDRPDRAAHRHGG